MIKNQKWKFIIVYQQEYSSQCMKITSMKITSKEYDNLSEVFPDIQDEVDILTLKDTIKIVDIEIIRV